MEVKKTLLSTLMFSGLVLGGYAGLAHTQHQDFNTNFTAIAHADTTEGTIMKFSDGASVVAKRDAQGNQIYDYVTKDGLTSQILNTTNMTVADKGKDALVLSDSIGYAVVQPGGNIYMASSTQGMSKNIETLNSNPNVLYFGVAEYNTVGNTKIPVAFTKIVKDNNGKYYVQKEYGVTTGHLSVKKDSDGKTIADWIEFGSPMTTALLGNADVTTADNGDVTIKFNPDDEGYTQFLQKQDGTYTNNLLSRGKSANNSSSNISSLTASSSSVNLSANEINTTNDGKEKVSRIITYAVQTPDGLKQVGSYTYNGAENQFNADQVAQHHLPKGYKIVKMLDIPTVGADGSNDSNAFTYLVEKDTDSATSSSVTPSAVSSLSAKASSTVVSAVGSGNVSDVNHSSVASSASAKPSDTAKDTAKNDSVAKSSIIASSSVSKSDAKDVSGAAKDATSAKSSSVVSSSESSHSMSSKPAVSSKASSESALSKSSSSEVKSSMSESSKVSSLAKSASSKLAENDKSSSVSNKDASSVVKSSSESVGSQSSSVIGQAGTAGQSGQNGGSSAAPEANTTNPGDGTTTTTSTSTTPGDDTYSPQKAAMLAKTNAKAAQSGIIAAIGLAIGTVAGWFGLKKKMIR